MGSLAPADADQLVAVVCGLPFTAVSLVMGCTTVVESDSDAGGEGWSAGFVRLVKQLSPFNTCANSLVLEEFGGVKAFGRKPLHWSRRPRFGALSTVKNGRDVIDAFGLTGKKFDGEMKQLIALTVGYLIVSCFGMLRHYLPDGGAPTQQQKKISSLCDPEKEREVCSE